MKTFLNILFWFFAIIGFVFTVFVILVMLIHTEADSISDIHNKCMRIRIEKGYSKKEANKYCQGISKGCVEKLYEENCNPEIKCCFVTKEEEIKYNKLI